MSRTGRRGALQLMLILLFVLLLILGLALLTVERSASTDENGYWRAEVGFADAQAMTALVGLLRQPIDADLDGDDAPERVTIADAIAADRADLDNEVLIALNNGLPREYAWSITVTYSDRTLERAHDIISPDSLAKQDTVFLVPVGDQVDDQGTRVDAASLVWKPCSPWDYTCKQPERGEGTGVAELKLPGASIRLLLGARFGDPPDKEERG